MLDDGVGEEVEGLERVHFDEGVELHVGVLEGDERQPHLSPDRHQVGGQGARGLGHAQPDLVQRHPQVAEVVAGGVGRLGDERPLRLVRALVQALQLQVRPGGAGKLERLQQQLLLQGYGHVLDGDHEVAVDDGVRRPVLAAGHVGGEMHSRHVSDMKRKTFTNGF